MKGAIFTGLSEFVEQEFGLTHWLKTVDSCQLDSNGEYISTELYEDIELSLLLSQLNKSTGLSVEQLSRKFGEYFFDTLMNIAKVHVSSIDNLFEFLVAVDTIIHIEVQKADPFAYTPSLFYDQPNESILIMRYSSQRKMCHFAEGLILGAAKYFETPVTISQSKCMCKGDEHCLIRIEK